MDQSLTSNNNNSLQDYKNAINIINPFNDSVTIGKIQKEGFKYYSDFFNMHYNLIEQYCNETIDEYGNTLVHILAIVNGGEKFLKEIKYLIKENIWNQGHYNDLFNPHIKASRYGKFNNFKFFIENFKHLILKDGIHKNVLMFACANPDERIFKYIIQNLTDLNIKIEYVNITKCISNIFLHHIPNKYKLRRLKLLKETFPNLINLKSIMENIYNVNDFYVIEKILQFYKNSNYLNLSFFNNLIQNLQNYTTSLDIKFSSILNHFKDNSEFNKLVLASFNYIECYQNKFWNYIITNYPDKGRKALMDSKPLDILEKVISIIYKFQNIESQTFCLTCNKNISCCGYNMLNLITDHPFFYNQSTMRQLLQSFYVNNWNANYNYNTKCIFIIILYSKFPIGALNLKNYNSNFCNIIFKGIKLKLALKRYIKKYFIKKRKYFHDLNANILSKILTFSPDPDIPVLSKGSYLYNLNKIKMKSKSFPINLDICSLAYLESEECLVKEKADGIACYEMPIEFYPSIEHLISNEIKAEYIEELNLYLVFDIDIPTYNISERYTYLRSLHPATNHFAELQNVNSIDELIKLLKKEREILSKFVADNPNKTIWYPKISFKIAKNNMLKDLTRELMFNSDSLKYNQIMNQNIFPIDGLIIQPLNGMNEIKIKPFEHLTADLLWTGKKWMTRDRVEIEVNHEGVYITKNQIWRCYWENNIWKPREIRWEKNKANPNWIVQYLEEYHKNPWHPDELKSDLKSYYHNVKKSIDINLINIFKYQRKIQKTIFDKMQIKSDKKWLDIGCGKGNLLFNIKDYNPNLFVGIDSDPYCIGEARNKYNDSNYHFIFHDMNQDNFVQKYNNTLPTNNIFDYIVINFAIHFGTNFLETWINKINQRSDSNSLMFINILDIEVLKTKFEGKFEFDNNYLKLVNYENENESYQIETFFGWTHNYPIIEKVYSIQKYIEIFKNNKWIVEDQFNPKTNNLSNLYRWIVLKKDE